MATHKLEIEAFSLPAKKGTRLLVFQDNPGDDGSPSEEGRRARKLLEESFRDTAAK